MPGSEPPIPDLVAAIDQAAAALADVARVIDGYRRELIARGVDRDDALELCLALQRDLVFGALAE